MSDELELEPSAEREQREVRSIVECAGLQAVIKLAVRRVYVGHPFAPDALPLSVASGSLQFIEAKCFSPMLVSRLRLRASDKGMHLQSASCGVRVLQRGHNAGIPIDGLGIVWRFTPVLVNPGERVTVYVQNHSAASMRLIECTWWGVDAPNSADAFARELLRETKR